MDAVRKKTTGPGTSRTSYPGPGPGTSSCTNSATQCTRRLNSAESTDLARSHGSRTAAVCQCWYYTASANCEYSRCAKLCSIFVPLAPACGLP
eukprot:1632951-Rhodomonas_salina.1